MGFIIDPVDGDGDYRCVFLYAAAFSSKEPGAPAPAGWPGNGKAAQYAGNPADGAAQ